MNNIKLTGILKNIKDSHKIGNVEYCKANIITTREQDGKDDILTVCFKKFSNPYKDGDKVSFEGNIRSYSYKQEGRNKVDVYVFTYFDIPEEQENEKSNNAVVDGRICRMDEMHITRSGKNCLHFILANNLTSGEHKLNSYIPCVAWGQVARDIEKLGVSSIITIYGELHSREFKKTLDNGEIEIRVAHELSVDDFQTGSTEE